MHNRTWEFDLYVIFVITGYENSSLLTYPDLVGTKLYENHLDWFSLTWSLSVPCSVGVAILCRLTFLFFSDFFFVVICMDYVCLRNPWVPPQFLGNKSTKCNGSYALCRSCWCWEMIVQYQYLITNKSDHHLSTMNLLQLPLHLKLFVLISMSLATYATHITLPRLDLIASTSEFRWLLSPPKLGRKPPNGCNHFGLICLQVPCFLHVGCGSWVEGPTKCSNSSGFDNSTPHVVFTVNNVMKQQLQKYFCALSRFSSLQCPPRLGTQLILSILNIKNTEIHCNILSGCLAKYID